MKLEFEILLSMSTELRDALARLGISEPSTTGIRTVSVAESDSRWPALRKWALDNGFSIVANEQYSEAELFGSAWVLLGSEWANGYPQPNENEFGYISETYDLSTYCPACKKGARQRAPFQLRGEPKWGRRGLMRLNWIDDELFVRSDVWEKYLLPLGVGSLPVLDRRRNKLTSVVQLNAHDVRSVRCGGAPVATCNSCTTVRYRMPFGPFYGPVVAGNEASFRTAEVFEAEGLDGRRILVSGVVYRALAGLGLRGVNAYPAVRDSAMPTPETQRAGCAQELMRQSIRARLP